MINQLNGDYLQRELSAPAEHNILFHLVFVFQPPPLLLLLPQVEAVSADIIALSEHTYRLGELVVNSVGHANEDANMTLAVIGTIFLPLTFIAGMTIQIFLKTSVFFDLLPLY